MGFSLKSISPGAKYFSGSENSGNRATFNEIHDPLDLFGGQAARAAKEAARAQKEATKAAVAEEARQFNETKRMLKPFHDIGVEQLPGLQERATSEGYGTAIDRLLSGVDAISQSRNDAAQAYADKMGLNRDLSGIGNLSPDEAMQLEDMLNQRSQTLAGIGLTQGENIARFGQNSSNAISGLIGLQGQNLASGVLNAQNARTGGLNNALAIGGAMGSYFGNSAQAQPQSSINYNTTAPQSYFKQGGGMSIF